MKNNCYRTIKRLFMFMSIILFSMISTGCYANLGHRYPTSWPELQTGDDVERLIEGSYTCSGEIINTDTGLREQKNITDFLTGLWEKRDITDFSIGKDPIHCQYLIIKYVQNEGLEFRFMENDNEQGLEFQYMGNDNDNERWKALLKKNRDFNTKNGWILLKAKGKFGVGDTTAGYHSINQYLSVSTEGDLLIKSQQKTVGIVSVAPIILNETVWGLFKRVKQ